MPLRPWLSQKLLFLLCVRLHTKGDFRGKLRLEAFLDMLILVAIFWCGVFLFLVRLDWGKEEGLALMRHD